jgi:eukaryotic-like serine/threonine-protein kinase
MALETRPPEILRFATFEVDVRAGELRKQGKRVKLQEQPFHVLTVLLQRPGEVVTREELRNENWPPDTFVDFENSLNTAINKVREALGDSADNPRFIETLPRRGYRFLAPVSSDQRKRSRSISGKWVGAGVTTVVAVVAVASGLFWHSRRPVLTDKDTIVLGDFANFTGDPVFDGTLREGLLVQLAQSPFLALVSDDAVQQTLRMMAKPADSRLTPEITREVCQRTGSAAALEGSIALIGSRYDLVLKAVDCAKGGLLASAEAQAYDKSHVLDALSKTASEMRRKLGESLSMVQKYDMPLEQTTTSSLEALQALTLGARVDFALGVPLFQKAIELDPNFAMAYDQLGGSYQAVGETTLGADNIRKAFELRQRANELEKLEIEGDYYHGVTGNLLDAQRSFGIGEQIYPREPAFHGGPGVIENILGQYKSALQEFQEFARLRPFDPAGFRFVAYTLLLMDRVEDAAAVARDAKAKGLDASLGPTVYLIAFYRNDAGAMTEQVAAAKGTAGVEDLLLALDADTDAYFGHLARAREISRQAADSARRSGDREASATYLAFAALREGLLGNPDKAAEQLKLAKPPSATSASDLCYAFALASAYAGDANRAQRIMEDLGRRFPEGTVVQFNYLPTLRAKLGLMRSNPQKAILDLEPAIPYELGLPALGFYNWPNLYPVYVRGEAYLAAHQGREAAAEFQKILDHRGIVLNEPIGALAHLQLGRAYAMQGDTAKARAAYQDFLTLWKDADPGIRIFKQAKAEYAKLR